MQGIIISENGFEDLELYYPYYRLKEEGVEVELASTSRGSIEGEHGYVAEVERNIYHSHADYYDFLILPGGSAASKLKNKNTALKIIKGIFEEGKPVAAIGHGTEVLISAGVMEGKKATGHESLKEKLEEVDGEYKARDGDEETGILVDGNLITAKYRNNLSALMKELLKKIK